MLSRNIRRSDLMIVAGISVLAIFSLTGVAWAQSHEEWNTTFKGNAFASSVAQTLDGGYIIAGNIDSYEGDTLLIKTDEKGNVWLIKVSVEQDGIDRLDKTLTEVPAMTAGTEKVAGFGANLAITILLAVYTAGRKRKMG